MKDVSATETTRPGPLPAADRWPDGSRWRLFAIAAGILLAGFALPLIRLAGFAFHSDTYSFTLLVPLISGYFVWSDRQLLGKAGPRLPPAWGALLLLAGVALLGWHIANPPPPGSAALQDNLAILMPAFVFFAAGLACLFLGRTDLRVLAMPIGFLIFLAPFTVGLESRLENMLQVGSAQVAQWFFGLDGMPCFREDTVLRLPDFMMQVAPECSGLHATLALLITSVVAARLLLHSGWRSVVLVLVVVPIALLRNGFRVFVIGELCVRVGHYMIDSWIHHHGGPVFFALSLVPFGLVLYLLIKTERRGSRATPATPS